MNPFVVGALINSALYLGSVFVGGLVLHVTAAWAFAIAAMGVAYLNCIAGAEGRPRIVVDTLAALSVILGALAGAALVFATVL